MSRKNAEKFIERANSDKEIQEKLAQRGKAYQGSSSDLEEVVRQNILPVAKELGLSFKPADYIKCLKEQSGRKKSSRKLSEDDLDAVVGGVGDVSISDSSAGGDINIWDMHVENNYYFVLPGASPEALSQLMQ